MSALAISTGAAALLLAASTSLHAQAAPVQNVDPARHGNLAAAQVLVRDAYDRLSEAQAANHGELGGHAARAKEMLREANDEIKLAAVYANGGIAPPVPALEIPPGVVYVPPTDASPGPGWVWSYHARYGWGWLHATWGWHRGWY